MVFSSSVFRFAFSLALCFAFELNCVAEDGDTRQAIALYNQNNYAAALQAFTAISTKDPANSSAIYYAANCEIGLGHTSAASKLYKRLIADFPATPEATSARAVLQRMGIVFGAPATNSAESGNGEKSGRKLPSNQTSLASSRTPMSADAKNRVIEKIVVRVRALAGRPEVADSTLGSVKEALTSYPTPLLSVLYSKGCKVFVTPTLIDKEPQLANSQPAGYEQGETFKNCPGMFNGNIVLCEKIFVGDGFDLQKAPDIIGTLRHELGHAVDWYLGDLTAKDDYKHQYLLDLGTIDDDVKNKLAYYCQKDRRGQKETFAELMCFKYGGRPSGSSRTALVGNSFKLTRSYVDRVINEVDTSSTK